MKKQVWRDKKLAPFSLNIEELRALCLVLSEEFDEPDGVRISIEVNLPSGVRLEFESVEEMAEYPSLPNVINEYEIWINGKGQSLKIECRPWESKVNISVNSEKEAWCTGVIEAVSSALRKYRIWHRWIPHRFFWIFIYCIPFIDFYWKGLVFRDVDSALLFCLLFGVVMLVTLVFWGRRIIFVKGRILPTGAIRVREKEGFIRCHSTQIMMALGLITAVAAIINVFKPWIFGS